MFLQPNHVSRCQRTIAIYAATVVWSGVLATNATLATTYNWSGNGGPNLMWNNPANWGGIGFPNAAGDVANFGNVITQNMTVHLGQTITVGVINFTEGTHSYTISGGAPPLSGGAASSGGVFSLILDNGPTPDAEVNVLAGNAMNHTIAADLFHSCIKDDVGSNTNLTFQGSISGGQAISHRLPTSNVGTVVLAGVNNFNGDVYVQGGTLRLGVNGSMPNGSTLKIYTPATVDVTAGVNETVQCLVLNDVPQAAGSYNSGNSLGRITGPGSIISTVMCPAVSEWGLLALTLLVLAAGTVVLRRRMAPKLA